MFVDRTTFERRIAAGGFLEHAEFLGNLYGTPVPEPPPGRDLILEIDVQGARQVLATHPEVVLVFLEAPSPEEQEARLRRRGDPEEKVAQRLAKAAEEASAGAELGATVIVNHEVGRTADEIYETIQRARRGGMVGERPARS